MNFQIMALDEGKKDRLSPNAKVMSNVLALTFDSLDLIYAAGATSVNAPANNTTGIDSSIDY